MLVSLKVPDNIAITAFNTLKRVGYKELEYLERSEYYKFEISGDKNRFKKEISNADILVNANKHKVSFLLEKNDKKIKNHENEHKIISVLVQDMDNDSSLLSTLKERLGFNNIKKLEKGILWTIYFYKGADSGKIALDITKNLLINEHYQKFKII